MVILKAALLYFGIVFGCGFALGVVRVGWLVPRLGERAAELVEMPLMLVAVFLAARLVVHRIPPRPSARCAVGILALGLLIVAEVLLVLSFRGQSLAEYVATRDPVSGTAYLVSLGLFAAAPALVARGRSARGQVVPGPPPGGRSHRGAK